MRRPNARSAKSQQETTPRAMDSSAKLQFRTNLFAKPPPKTSRCKFLIIGMALISIALLLYLFITVILASITVKRKYGIVIDGGSTGTRIHVFEYRIEGGKPRFDFGKGGLASMRVSPGLSAYREEVKKSRVALEELVKFAKGKVPKEYWKETGIRLMATAGMRLLEVGDQEAILEECREVLRPSGFMFRDEWASVITGSDEGVYAWVVANYAFGTLGGDPFQTTGIIELGGASAQVTFVSVEPMPQEFSRTIRFGNYTYTLYSHSFLHFGQNVAYDALRDSLASRDQIFASESRQSSMLMDPCTPRGYSHDTASRSLSPGYLTAKNKYPSMLHPTGNFSECRSAALKLLWKDKEKCSYQHCYLGSTFTPRLHGRFLATENFFHTSKFFGLSSAYLSNLVLAGEEFCQDDWSKLKKKYQMVGDEDLMRYCFSSAYIVALLHDGFGISLDDERVTFANSVGDIPLDWALGALVLQSASELDVDQHDWIYNVIRDDPLRLLTLLVISIFLTVAAWSVSKWRKPQMKTIYDLEKGRYIITRVNRC